MARRRNRIFFAIAVLGIGVLGTVAFIGSRTRPGTGPRSMTPEAAEAVARQYLALEAREQGMDQGLWAPELDAERHEDEWVRLADTLNATTNDWDVLAAFPVDEVRLSRMGRAEDLPHGIRRQRGTRSDSDVLDAPAWKHWLLDWGSRGWTIAATRWSLVGHEPEALKQSARSSLLVTARLENPAITNRAFLRARVSLEWRPDREGGIPVLHSARVDGVELLDRTGPVPFRLWMEAELRPDPARFNDPLIVRDLTGDGRPELLLAGAGEVWINDSARLNATEPFRRGTAGSIPVGRIQAAVMCDVDGDRREDLVLAGKEGVSWLPQEGRGGFGAARSGWVPPIVLKHPQAITAGDVDGDGDIDLWLVQYKLPYQQGQFPTPWFDAKDGFPAYLLLNDGHGNFTDATAGSGLEPVRDRRTYSASWLDLDGDGDLDLVNVSDFSGLDVFLNDGNGHFARAGQTLGEERHAFGMAHAINDFNGDGHPDVLMLGMGSVVADRLRGMGLQRLAPGESPGMVEATTRGNRLFAGDAGPGNPLRSITNEVAVALASTGWTWGAAWEDFDNDGHLDLAVANGHETRASTADYERQFWLHDRFVGGSANDPAAEFYFRTASGRRQAAQASYGGWQDNELRLQVGPADFPDVAWLLGLAESADCRNLVAADLDLDGRMDLILTTQEEWPVRRQRLLVFRNELPAAPWIGFRFTEAPPPGTQIVLEFPGKLASRWLINGDGFRSQAPAMTHFGLGDQRPTVARIQSPGGRVTLLTNPAVRRWNVIPLSVADKTGNEPAVSAEK